MSAVKTCNRGLQKHWRHFLVLGSPPRSLQMATASRVPSDDLAVDFRQTRENRHVSAVLP